jgi:hypothetical protein
VSHLPPEWSVKVQIIIVSTTGIIDAWDDKIVNILENIMVYIALVHRFLAFVAEIALVQMLHKGESLLLNSVQTLYMARVFALDQT